MFRYVIPERLLVKTIERYKKMNIHPILDYAVENSRSAHESALYAKHKIDLLNRYSNECHSLKLSSLGLSYEHFENVMLTAKMQNCVIMVDAENHEKQSRIKAFTDSMVANSYDRHVFTTYQMYKKESFSMLLADIEEYKRCGLMHNIKLVRGAYLYQDGSLLNVLHNTKRETDEAYNEATKLLLDMSKDNEHMNVVFATHNRQSLELLKNLGSRDNLSHAFLMGMERPFFFENDLRKLVHIPFGPLFKTAPYMLRRLMENNPYLDRLLTKDYLKNEKTQQQTA